MMKLLHKECVCRVITGSIYTVTPIATALHGTVGLNFDFASLY